MTDTARNLSDEELRTFAAEREARAALTACSPQSTSYHRLQADWVDAMLEWRGAVARAHVLSCEVFGIPHLHRVG